MRRKLVFLSILSMALATQAEAITIENQTGVQLQIVVNTPANQYILYNETLNAGDSTGIGLVAALQEIKNDIGQTNNVVQVNVTGHGQGIFTRCQPALIITKVTNVQKADRARFALYADRCERHVHK